MSSLSQQIIALRPEPTRKTDSAASAAVDDHVRARINQQFATWESLVGPRIEEEIQRLKKEEEASSLEVRASPHLFVLRLDQLVASVSLFDSYKQCNRNSAN